MAETTGPVMAEMPAPVRAVPRLARPAELVPEQRSTMLERFAMRVMPALNAAGG